MQYQEKKKKHGHLIFLSNGLDLLEESVGDNREKKVLSTQIMIWQCRGWMYG